MKAVAGGAGNQPPLCIPQIAKFGKALRGTLVIPQHRVIEADIDGRGDAAQRLFRLGNQVFITKFEVAAPDELSGCARARQPGGPVRPAGFFCGGCLWVLTCCSSTGR